jgi:iron complex outermembrane receptor protein
MLKTKIVPLGLLISAAIPAIAMADHVDLPEMSVTGVAGEMIPYPVPQTNVSTPDVGELFKKLPGANINQNGPLTSIVQYRGMYGDRVNVMVDGVRPATAGPNRMDTPLSYVPSSQLENLTIYRGIAPVSSGIETIGGTVKAESKKAEFGSSDEAEYHGSLNGLYASNGDVRSGGLTTSVANQQHKLQISGTSSRGNDLEFDGGKIEPSEHKRDTVGVAYGFRQDNTELDVDLNHHDTGKTGTPALPMDIIWIRGETAKVGVKQQLGNGGELSARLNYQDTEHRMDNYSLRPRDVMFRYNDADVNAKGLQLQYSQAEWRFGVDADMAEHNSTISDPTNTAFFVENFNNVERNRFSAFGEWNGALNDNWDMQSGLRLTRVDSDSDRVNSSMGMLNTLRDSFNNADRSKQDTLADIALTFTRHLNSALDLQLGVARKERAPSYVERYLSAPLQSTSGLADGKTYLGNLDLDPETAYQFELGIDWHESSFALSPRVFYHHVNDYIQGTAAGTPPAADLQFNNVDAKLYGIDTNWLWAMTSQWQLDGTVSYVRGERRDTDDNLYRIAPLTARTQLSYIQPDWRIGFEAVTVAAQNKVSAENDEEKTGGYAYYNLSGQYQVSQTLSVQAGVNNLFDRKYRDHLGGYNRAMGNDDIAVGERLPGLGRSLYVGLNLNW